MKIRTWDTVTVIAGKDKSATWKVLKVFLKTNRILVEWVNVVTKHIKKQGTNPGQILKMEKKNLKIVLLNNYFISDDIKRYI